MLSITQMIAIPFFALGIGMWLLAKKLDRQEKGALLALGAAVAYIVSS